MKNGGKDEEESFHKSVCLFVSFRFETMLRLIKSYASSPRRTSAKCVWCVIRCVCISLNSIPFNGHILSIYVRTFAGWLLSRRIRTHEIASLLCLAEGFFFPWAFLFVWKWGETWTR